MRRTKEEQSHGAQVAAYLRENRVSTQDANRRELARLLESSRKTAQDSVKKVSDRQQQIVDNLLTSISRVWGGLKDSRLGEIDLSVSFAHPGLASVEIIVKRYAMAYRRDFDHVFADPDQQLSHDCDLAAEVGLLLGVLEVVANPALQGLAKSPIPALWQAVDLSRVSHDPS